MREQRSVLEDRARDAVTTTEELLDDESEVAYTSVVEHGLPHEAIHSYASENAIDLVVIGTHGRTGLDRLLLGSVTRRVIRTGDVPVLAVPPNAVDRAELDIESILIPTDGSSGAAVDHGLSLAEWFDASVHVLSVVRTGSGLPTIGDPDREGAEETVQAIAERVSDRDLTCETHVQAGTPHERIRNFVRSRGIDLVTMGTHGRSGVSRHLLGSVTGKVLRTSDAPVLTVRAGTVE